MTQRWRRGVALIARGPSVMKDTKVLVTNDTEVSVMKGTEVWLKMHQGVGYE